MKKISRSNRALLTFMASTPGRLARGLTGVALAVLAFMSGGWFLLLLLPATMMMVTGIVNYCPAGLLVTGSGKSENIMATMAKYNALGSAVHKH
jgi:hypothetical protein